jgi:hypothetical protein
VLAAVTVLTACNNEPASTNVTKETLAKSQQAPPQLIPEFNNRLSIYKEVTLSADLSHLSANQKQMLALLIDASKIMDDLFWQQAFSQDKKTFLAKIKDKKVRRFAEINYGPWDRLDGDKVFLTQNDAKAHGAEFYPKDMTKTEFEQTTLANKDGLYSIISRDDEGQLITIAYSELYSDEINRAAAILEKASTFADDK